MLHTSPSGCNAGGLRNSFHAEIPARLLEEGRNIEQLESSPARPSVNILFSSSATRSRLT